MKLDIPLEETTICIVDDAGSIVRELRGRSDRYWLKFH